MARLEVSSGRQGSAGSGWRRALRSFRVRMIALVVAVALLIGLAITLLLLDGYRAHTRLTELQLHETADALSLAVDDKILAAVGVLKALETSPYLASGAVSAFDLEARQAMTEPNQWVVLFDENGRQLVNTSQPRGVPLALAPLPDFKFYKHAVAGRDVFISDLINSSLTGHLSVGLAILVRTPGKPAYYLAVAQTPEVPHEVLAAEGLPASWYGALFDRSGRVIARNTASTLAVGRTAPPGFAQQIQHKSQGVFKGRSPLGEDVIVAFRRSLLTGWTLVVALPLAAERAELIRSLAFTVFLVLVLLSAGAALVWRFADVASRAVGGLQRGAEALGRGEAVASTPTGLSETDAVGQALHNASLRLKQRDENLQRLTGGVAHDFNNLLTVVIGSLDMLGRRLTEPRLNRLVAAAREAAERGASLTGKLLAIGRRQRLTPEPLDLNQLMAAARPVGEAFRVVTRPAADAVWTMADRTQLELALDNLLVNARDAMPGGGEVVIEAGYEIVTGPAPDPEAPRPGSYAVLSVRDAGVGMTPEVRGRIFEPFFTTKARGAGTGLGLPQVLGVAQQLGGGVTVETAPGRGACVRLYLPRAEPPHAPTARSSVPEVAELAGRKVMLVDDDDEVRAVTAELMRDMGCEAEDLSDGAAAQMRLEAGARPDLLVTDYAMPGMTGAELAHWCARTRPYLPVLLISGYLDVEALEQTWKGLVLTKPFSREALAASLARALPPRNP
jgi:signal transduction histidine kinase